MPNSAGEAPPTERTGVNRLEPWLENHPEALAGFWVVLTVSFVVNAILRDRDEPFLIALNVTMALFWAFMFVRQVRRTRARRQ